MTGSSGPWPRTAFARSRPCGATRAGCPAPHPLPRSGAHWPSSDGELPQGAGGPLPAGRDLLDHLLPQAVRGQREAVSDHLVADLERAEPEEVLRPLAHSPGKYATLLQISYPAIKSKDPQARIVARRHARIRRRDRVDVPLEGSTRCPGSRATSTPSPSIRTEPLSKVKMEIQRVRTVDEEPRRRRDAAVGRPRSHGDRRPRTATGSTRGSPVRRRC